MIRHTTRTVLLSLVLAAALAWMQPAQAQLGFGAGLNFNNLGDIEATDTDATFENSTGYHVGVFYNLNVGPISVRPGAYYHRIGTYDLPTGEEFDLSAVEIPIDLRFTVLPTPIVKPYLLGGPVLTFPQGEDEFEDAVEDMSLTADIGAGLSFSLPGLGLTLEPELRYSIGVTNYLKDDFEVGPVEIQPESDDQRLSKVMLRLNVMF